MFLEIKNGPSPHNLGKLWGCPLNYLGQGQIQTLQIFILYFVHLKEIDLQMFLQQGCVYLGSVERGNSRFATTRKHTRKGLEREEESWYRGGKRGRRVLISKEFMAFH